MTAKPTLRDASPTEKALSVAMLAAFVVFGLTAVRLNAGIGRVEANSQSIRAACEERNEQNAATIDLWDKAFKIPSPTTSTTVPGETPTTSPQAAAFRALLVQTYPQREC
jgi:hypothetical protein